jgi:hypothetical protein
MEDIEVDCLKPQFEDRIDEMLHEPVLDDSWAMIDRDDGQSAFSVRLQDDFCKPLEII